MNVLAIGAHPDDVELGCGGTIVRHKNCGDRVFILVITSGKFGGDPKIRVKEAIESAKILGAEVFFGELEDTKISDKRDTISAIEKYVNKVQPEIVYTHAMKDTHQDHRSVALATISAARTVPKILFYEEPTFYYEFTPRYFVNISDTIDQKILAIKVHKSQKEKEYWKAESIRGLAQFRGFQAGVKYAEAFEIAKYIIR